MTTLPNLGRVSDLGRLPIHGRPTNWTSLGRITSTAMSLDFTSAALADVLSAYGFAFARADAVSCATYIDSSGVMQVAPANAMRQTHDPVTLAPLGYLCEETSTNHVRNSTMVGVVTGSPGTLPTNWTSSVRAGITQSIVATGTLNGIQYVDVKFSGTASSNGDLRISFDADAFVAAAPSQSWTLSAYYALVSGNAPTGRTFHSTITFRDSGGAEIVAMQSPNIASGLTSALQRFIFSPAASPALTAYVHPYFGCTVQIGDVVDFTLRIGAPQLEQKAFATSYIATSGTARTRQDDALRCSTLASQAWFNQAEGSVVVRARRYHVAANGSLCEWANGSVTNRVLTLVRINRQSAVEITNASATTSATCLTAHGASDEFRAASAVGPSGNAISLNGGAVGVGGSAPVGSGYTTFDIGRTAWAATYFGGTIARLDYYNRRLSNAELQALTA